MLLAILLADTCWRRSVSRVLRASEPMLPILAIYKGSRRYLIGSEPRRVFFDVPRGFGIECNHNLRKTVVYTLIESLH